MNIKTWLGQATTGAGFATTLAGFGAMVSGALSWQQAVPLLVAGVSGVIWPENTKLQAATRQAAADICTGVAALQTSDRTNGSSATTVQPAVSVR